jgi:tetratricopeptide (TPR) repeat protein
LKAHLDEVATMEKATKPDHPDVAKVLMTLAGFYVERNRTADAWPVADRAREIVEKSAPLLVANAYEMLAVVRAAEKRYPEAEQLLQKAIAVDAKTPSDRAQMGERIGKLGDIYRDAGKPDLAVASYESAVAYWVKEADKPDKLAFAQYALAQAIANKDPARAAELRTAAGNTLDKLGLAKPHD